MTSTEARQPTATRRAWLLFFFLAQVALACASCSTSMERWVEGTPGSGASYPSSVRYLPFGILHTQRSILPGDAKLDCAAAESVFEDAGLKIKTVDCAGVPEVRKADVLRRISDALRRLREASGAGHRICSLTLVLVDAKAGISGKDRQWIRGDCARLQLLVRWNNDYPMESGRALVRVVAHESHHLLLALERGGARESTQAAEEEEASAIGYCAEKLAFGTAAPTELPGFETGHGVLTASVKGRSRIDEMMASGRIGELEPSSGNAYSVKLVAYCTEALESHD